MDEEINDGFVAGTGAGGAARAGVRTGDGDDDKTEQVDRLADDGVTDSLSMEMFFQTSLSAHISNCSRSAEVLDCNLI